MSLVRQVWLMLATTLLLALTGGVGVAVQSARDALQTQVRIKNNDNAAALALAASQSGGDPVSIELLLSAQFDTGFYRSVRWLDPAGVARFERSAESHAARAPVWFVRALPIEADIGTAQLSAGWKPLGSIQVATQTAYAHDDLWQAALRAAAVMGALGLAAGLLSTWVVRRIARALDASVQQAQALLAGRFVTLPESRIPELQRFTRALNAMVGRLKLIFEAQATQVENLRRQATTDPLTGLPRRSHFLSSLQADLERDDGPAQVSLVLLRLGNLENLNRVQGHAATDRLIVAVAHTLHDYAEQIRGSLIGRLNGSDFAVCLPVGGVARESGLAIAQALQVVVPTLAAGAAVSVGVAEIDRAPDEGFIGRLLGLADAALARAESLEPFAVQVIETGESARVQAAGAGERAWRTHIATALSDDRRMALAAFATLDRADRLIHLDCPMRLQLTEGGPFEPAAFWLPLALRARATARVDEQAVALAMAQVLQDGQARSVNVSHASLIDPGFLPRLRDLLAARPRAARLLWLEVPEAAAVEQFQRLQQLTRELRPLGAKVGLEHAGHRLREIPALYEAGLDFVKLDAAVVTGLAEDESRAAFVAALVTLLHGVAIQVLAEGVDQEADAQALWAAGVDGVTGPWASRRHPARTNPPG